MDWKEQIRQIQQLDAEAMAAAKNHWDSIGKPLNSLGQLEKLITQIAGITGEPAVTIEKKCVIAMCADNGVVAEGVTQTDSSVTAIVAKNMAAGTANVNAMARMAGAEVFPVDIGIVLDCPYANLQQEKIAYGTKNFAKESAMTREEAERAVAVGVRLVQEKKQQGYQMIATGEMGIGNTTTSSAILHVLLEEPVAVVTGRGAGLSDAGLRKKQAVIEEAVRRHRPDKNDPLDVLRKVGGLDIAGMVGLFLGGAIYHVPIVIDGLISGTAALLAAKIMPCAVDYMLASHLSREPASEKLFSALGLHPILHADLALGEGTGAVTLFPLLDMALSVYRQNTTFAKLQIPQYIPLSEE